MLTDVIAALATAPGRGAVALIRMSGAGSHDVAARVLVPFDATPGRQRRARVTDPTAGEDLDDVLYSVFAGPASYTGDDVVEISTHGGLMVPAEVLGAVYAAGARPAAAGEFTRRALRNGKIDLLQAEAIGDLVDATAPAQRRAARAQLNRGLSRRIDALREGILELESLISYDIDFPEEDGGPVPAERIDASIVMLREHFDALLESAVSGERLRDGALVVIAGRPNVGKSSLFNALVGSDRVIVTEEPGTTRDAVEVPIVCDGYPFRLVDTAGLRDTEDRIERLGVEVSRRYLAEADVVLFCVEAQRALDAGERQFIERLGDRALVVRTKADLGRPRSADQTLCVSALQNQGLGGLSRALAMRAFSSRRDAVEPAVTRSRHRLALERGRDEITLFSEARRKGIEAAVTAVHLRAAVSEVETVIGVVTTDDVLDRVFSSFCIGK